MAAGLARGTLLSPAEAWAQGLRVHPEHRRRGLGTALLDRLAEWAAGQGAKVIRLSSEDSNTAAGALIPTAGFRPAGRWLIVEKEELRAGPTPRGNGGKRAPAADRLRPAPAPEADAAMISWSGGPLEMEARGLFSQHWCCRRLTLADLAGAARRGALWQGRTGWLLGERDRDEFEVHWLSTYPEDARAMVAALLDLAAAAGADRLEAQLPAVDWLRSALDRAGCATAPADGARAPAVGAWTRRDREPPIRSSDHFTAACAASRSRLPDAAPAGQTTPPPARWALQHPLRACLRQARLPRPHGGGDRQLGIDTDTLKL